MYSVPHGDISCVVMWQGYMFAHYVMNGLAEGARGRGRPNISWLNDIAEWTGFSNSVCELRTGRGKGE